MICTLEHPKEEQIGHFRDQRSDCSILQVVALPMFSCLAARPSVIPALMSFSAAETFSPGNRSEDVKDQFVVGG
ncbi:MAG: hypothetical protein F4X97_13610 [Boseongicola sp. SB0662_bin_57]|nr:hypothetical protein [Boseongicola sp. SB0662_bin_57]